ncbi:MAG: DNA-directed DNA polymerase [Candidatus Hodarchaeota archaeon]
MEIEFWTFDVGQIIKEESPQVLLWGIDTKGQRTLVIEDRFRPYFFVLPSEGVDPHSITDTIMSHSSPKSQILNVEVVSRKLFGKLLRVLKVSHQNPEDTQLLAASISRERNVKRCYETDIRFYTRYLIDKEIVPCQWYKAQAERVKEPSGIVVDTVYRLLDNPIPSTRETIPDLRILTFDMRDYVSAGIMNPEKDPVIVLTTATNTGEQRQFVAENHDDRLLLQEFVDYVRQFDPDFILGYYSNFHDLPFITRRARVLNANLAIGRDSSEPHPSLYGHYSIAGRANIDMYDATELIAAVKLKTLENIADFLEVIPRKSRTIIDDIQIAKHWDDEKLRPKLIKYSKENSESVRGIAERLLPSIISMAQVTGMPPDQVMRAGAGFRVENILLREAYRAEELAPNRVEHPPAPYVGGFVLEPQEGIHDNISIFDFGSLYPSLMIKYNLSPDTYLPPKEEFSGEEVTTPEVGHRFKTEPPGFYKRILEKLLRARKEIRSKMRNIDPSSIDYAVLNERQKAVKIIANAAYGYCGWRGARWYLKPVAEATAAWGRNVIKRTVEIAERTGSTVIYGDTDSIFIFHETEKIKGFMNRVENELGLKIKPDKIYSRILFTKAKKKYAGLLKDGTLDITGFEAVRGDWPAIAREIQEEVIRILLKDKAANKAIGYLRIMLERIQSYKIPYEKFVIWETLTKSPSEYKVRLPHVSAATKLIEAGGRLEEGSKIGYVVLRGAGRLSDRVAPYNLATEEKLDIDYYINNQIVPMILRVLEIFDVTKEQLIGTPQRSLDEILGNRNS